MSGFLARVCDDIKKTLDFPASGVLFAPRPVASIGRQQNAGELMSTLSRVFGNLRSYVASVLSRWKRRRKNKKEDPFIYPHF
jgi:hypothetical protein